MRSLVYAIYVFIIVGTAVLHAGCNHLQQPVNSEIVEKINKRKNNPWNIRSVDSSVALLRTGDIVVRRGNDITSYMLSQLNVNDKTFSHCGLVLVEDGYPFIYHSIGGEDNPDQVLRRDSASFWFSAAKNEAFGIVRFDDMADSNKMRAAGLARQYYKEKKKFDIHFDLDTEDRYYCAEFIYKILNRAMGDSLFIQPATVMGYTFVGIDNLFLNAHARFVCQIRFK